MNYVIPEGWKLQPYSDRGYDGFVVLTTNGIAYAATIDFNKRCIRSGFCTSGNAVGEKYDKKRGFVRPEYKGRGWQQKLVDDAVKHLKGLP